MGVVEWPWYQIRLTTLMIIVAIFATCCCGPVSQFFASWRRYVPSGYAEGQQVEQAVARLGGKAEIVSGFEGLVDLRGTTVGDPDLAELCQMPGFDPVYILLLSNTQIGDEGIRKLKDRFYSEIDLSRTKITDAGLEHLAHLRGPIWYLKLEGTAITDAGLEQITPTTPIVNLNTMNTRVTEEGVMRLIQRFQVPVTPNDDRFIKVLFGKSPDYYEIRIPRRPELIPPKKHRLPTPPAGLDR